MRILSAIKIFLCLLGSVSSMFSQSMTADLPKADPFIESLLSKMTLDEKLGQMTLFTTDWESTGPTIRGGYENDIKAGRCGALFNSHTVDFTTRLQKIAVEESRLKIPLLFGYDVIHGYKTMFPIPLAEAASWDLTAIENSAYIMSKEAASAGLHWTFAPMVDISRDPRWGRVMEGAGEDTYLGSRIAEARVKGIQGDHLGLTDRLVACVKHFAAYGAPIAGRDYNTVDMSSRTLFEYYLPPYKAAIDAGAKTVMTSFNDLDGIPSSINHWLLTDLLRDQWHFDGFVVTDYTSINEVVEHGITANETEAGILALKAGVDMDMQGGIFQEKIKEGIVNGQINMDQINDAARRILKVKKEMGLFDDPFKYSHHDREKATLFTQENRNHSRDMAKKSIVLLENNGILPIKNDVKKILLTGPLAMDKENLTGVWSAAGEGDKCISVMEGLSKALPNTDITYLKGVDFISSDSSEFATVLAAAKMVDIVIAVVGEIKEISGEAASRSDIHIPGIQDQFLAYLKRNGVQVITIVMGGRPLILEGAKASSSAVIEAWWLGTETGNAVADVVTGRYNPSGRLPMTFPRNVGQIPIYYNYKSTGRPFDPNIKWNSKYIDVENGPLYPFGYGLSYTTFDYAQPQVTQGPNGDVMAVVTVTNTGSVDGEDVVQLYIHDKVASVTRPVKELKGFKKIFLKKGESQIVEIKIAKKDLGFYDQNMQWTVEPGEFEIFVGGNSDTSNKTTIQIK